MVESFCMVFQCNTVNPPFFSAVKNQIWWVGTKDDKDGCNQNNNDEKKVLFEHKFNQKNWAAPPDLCNGSNHHISWEALSQIQIWFTHLKCQKPPTCIGRRTMIVLVILEWENSQGCCNDGVIYAVCAVRVIHSSPPHTSHPAMSAQLQNCTTLLMPLVIRPGNTQLCRLMGLPLQFQQSYITPHVGLLGPFITC